MKTTTLNRTVLAALMGSALTFGWGAPATARAQDGAVQEDGQPSMQKYNQSGKNDDEQARRDAREARKAQDNSNAAAAQAARGQEQAQARQRENQQRQFDLQRQVEQQREFNQQRQADQQRQVEQKREFNQQRQYDQQRPYDQQRQAEQKRREADRGYPQVQEGVAADGYPQVQKRVPADGYQSGGGNYGADKGAYDATKGTYGSGKPTYDARKGTYPTTGTQGDRYRDRSGNDGSREARIEEQRRQAEIFARKRDQSRYDADRWSRNLQSQHRSSGYRYQQDYWSRLSRQRYDWQNYDYYSDPYFYSAPSYRYYRGGNSYYINNYAADLLRQAINYGYREGIRAGQADRYDGWRFSYRDAYAYQDASYGYRGMYVDYDDYSYYFREGFRRGYEDGYYDNRRYGRSYNGSDDILQTVLSLILDLRPYR